MKYIKTTAEVQKRNADHAARKVLGSGAQGTSKQAQRALNKHDAQTGASWRRERN